MLCYHNHDNTKIPQRIKYIIELCNLPFNVIKRFKLVNLMSVKLMINRNLMLLKRDIML